MELLAFNAKSTFDTSVIKSGLFYGLFIESQEHSMVVCVSQTQGQTDPFAATSTVYCTTVQDKNIYKSLISGSCPIFVVMGTSTSNPRRIDPKNSFKNDQRPTTSREHMIRKHLPH